MRVSFFPDDQGGGEGRGQVNLADTLNSSTLEPSFHLAEGITSPMLRGQQHEESKQGSCGWLRERIVEDMVFYHDLAGPF